MRSWATGSWTKAPCGRRPWPQPTTSWTTCAPSWTVTSCRLTGRRLRSWRSPRSRRSSRPSGGTCWRLTATTWSRFSRPWPRPRRSRTSPPASLPTPSRARVSASVRTCAAITACRPRTGSRKAPSPSMPAWTAWTPRRRCPGSASGSSWTSSRSTRPSWTPR